MWTVNGPRWMTLLHGLGIAAVSGRTLVRMTAAIGHPAEPVRRLPRGCQGVSRSDGAPVPRDVASGPVGQVRRGRTSPGTVEWRGMDVRASDAERDATMNRLRDAAAEGRLTLEELTDRIEAAANAVMSSDLARVTSDLPVTAAVGVAMPPAGVRAVGDVR